MQIRENTAQYISDLKAWLKETEREPLEGIEGACFILAEKRENQ